MKLVPPHSKRVLVVEDEDTIGQVVTEALVDEGYEVRRARNGRDAIEVLRGWCPQVILLDLMMPELDGRGFRTEQRRLGSPAADVPVIVVSGAREARRRAAELGAVEALSKPFDLNRVVEAVGRWATSDSSEVT